MLGCDKIYIYIYTELTISLNKELIMSANEDLQEESYNISFAQECNVTLENFMVLSPSELSIVEDGGSNITPVRQLYSENSSSDDIDDDIEFSKIALNESSSENSKKISTHLICHCHTTLNCNVFEYTWRIGNFWTFKSLRNLNVVTCETGNQPFNIKAFFKRRNSKVYFYSVFSLEQKGLRVNYSTHIQTTKGPQMILNKKNIYLKHNSFINSINLKHISLNEITVYTPNNTLTVYFKFEVFEILHNTIHENIQQKHMSMFNIFVPNESDSQVRLVAEEKSILINKRLLCLKSNVFHALMNENDLMTNNELEITDITYDVLKRLVLYIETDNLVLDDLETNEDDGAYKVTSILYSLIKVAHKFDIKDLLLLCEQLLIQNTSENNVVEHLRVAHTNYANLLENYAIKFIKLYEYSIVKTEDFKTLIKTNPYLLRNIQRVELNTEKIICNE